MRWTLIAFVFACACSSSGTHVVGTGGTMSQMIGPSGGQLTLEGATLSIPAGALASPTQITITSTKLSIDRYQQYSPIYQFDPDGLEFAQPATLTITSQVDVGSALLLTTVHPAGPQVAWFQDLRGTVSGRTLSAPMRHFSDGMIANLPPCDKGQTAQTCHDRRCGDYVEIDEGAQGSLENFLLPIVFECVCHCSPCGPGSTRDPLTALQFNSTNPTSTWGQVLQDAVACDPSFIELIDTEKQYQWKVDSSTATVSTLTGAPLFTGAVPGGTNFAFGFDGTIPSIAMKSTNPTSSEVVTVSGTFQCPGQSIPTLPAQQDGGSGGNPDLELCHATLTSVNPTSGPRGTPVTITGTGFACVAQLNDYVVFTGTGDQYTYKPSEYTITGDTTISIKVPSVDDTGSAFQVTTGLCAGDFEIPYAIGAAPHPGMPYPKFTVTGTGTSGCP